MERPREAGHPRGKGEVGVCEGGADEVGGVGSMQTDLIILTHDCVESKMNAALAQMQASLDEANAALSVAQCSCSEAQQVLILNKYSL